MGEYFLVELDKQVYCFKIDDEICQYRQKLTKQFQAIIYDISHYRPIKPEIKELELLLKEEGLPKVNGTLADIFRILGTREKKELDKDGKEKPFSPHDLKKLIEYINNYEKKKIAQIIPKDQAKFAGQAKTIVNFLENLDVKQIATPLKSITNFIEDDLRSSDSKFFGNVAQTLQTLDYENKKVTNTPVRSSKAWMVWVLVFAMVGAVAVFALVAIEQGWFDDLFSFTDAFSGISFQPVQVPPKQAAKGDPCSDAALQKKYPEPVQLKIAIAEGTEPCTPSPFLQEILDGVDLPKVNER